MNTKALIYTNPYLKDPATRRKLVARSVQTSGGVEGIKIITSSKEASFEIPRRKDKKIYRSSKQTASAK